MVHNFHLQRADGATAAEHFFEKTPRWLYQSPEEMYSSFVTLDGQTGYFLNEKAEIVGIDLLTGNRVGEIVLSSKYLQPGLYANYLFVDTGHIYAVLSNQDLLVFKNED